MIWDDHDIFDGWGSYDPKKLASPFAQAIFEVAKHYFFLYQMCGDLTSVINEKDPSAPFNQATELTGNVGLLLLDLRTERVFDRVISDNSWAAVENWLNRKASKLERLFVVSSVPVVYPHSDKVNTLLSMIGNPGHMLDDARDHWIDKIHKEDTLHLVTDLMEYCKQTGCKVTVLTGDVHVGGTAKMESPSENILINQPISSGICAKAPALPVLFAFAYFFRQMFKVGKYRLKMQKLPNGHRYIRTSNFLSLLPDQQTGQYALLWIAKPKMRKAITEPLPPPVKTFKYLTP